MIVPVTKIIFVQIFVQIIGFEQHWPDIRYRYPSLPDIRQDNLVSGQIPVPDIKKGRIIRPDIRCIPNKKLVTVFAIISEHFTALKT
jgi:hypothetical protein